MLKFKNKAIYYCSIFFMPMTRYQQNNFFFAVAYQLRATLVQKYCEKKICLLMKDLTNENIVKNKLF